MNWLRLYSEARNDAKLRTLTDAEHRVWFNLLCYAAEQKDERGSIHDFDMELLAIEVASGDADLLFETLKKLSRLRIVRATDGGEITFLKFEERQYDKPSDRPSRVKERVHAHRERQKESESGQKEDNITTPETPPDEGGNAPKRDVTPCNAYTQKRTEKSREDKDPPNPPSGGSAGAVGNCVSLFIDGFRTKHEGEDPHILPPQTKKLRAYMDDVGRERFAACLAGFFADTWASEQGHSVTTFLSQSADRWSRRKEPSRAKQNTHPSSGHPPAPGGLTPEQARNGATPADLPQRVRP